METKCASYKERLIHASRTCKSLQKEKYELECEFEEMRKVFMNLSFDNQKLRTTIESQNEMITNFKSKLVCIFLFLSGI